MGLEQFEVARVQRVCWGIISGREVADDDPLATIWHMLRRLGLRHKKMLGAAEQGRPDVAAHRKRWRAWQRYMDPATFVFLDETGATTDMIRHHGWRPKGERLVEAAPQDHWRTTTFVAGLHSTGIVAPLVPGGIVDTITDPLLVIDTKLVGAASRLSLCWPGRLGGLRQGYGR